VEQRTKVLIVEDEALFAYTMQEVLSLFGFEVIGVAATVTEALHLSEMSKPDLAIFDVRLAGMRDGIEGARLLRERSGVPVVFVSAQGDQPTRDRAAAIGPVAYLVKPIQPQLLITAVEEAIRAQRSL
jgi:DNA-binding NarL/FixJ family response regulator